MEKSIKFLFRIEVFDISIHKAELIVDDKWKGELENIKSGQEVEVPVQDLKDEDGNSFPEDREPKSLEVKAAEGRFRFELK